MKRSIVGLVSVFLVSSAGILALPNPLDAAVPQEETPNEVLDRAETLTHAREYLKGAFRDAGYSARDADALGERAMNRMVMRIVEPYEAQDPIDAPSILDPDSDPILLIADHLETLGKSREESLEWAMLAYITANRIPDDPRLEGLDEGCSAYPVVISWCDDQGDVHAKRTWISAGCMDMRIVPCLPAQLPACPGQLVPYVEVPLRFNPAECQLITGTATCIWIKLPNGTNPPTEPSIVECEMMFGCECIDVDDIEENHCGTLHIGCGFIKGGVTNECPCDHQ